MLRLIARTGDLLEVAPSEFRTISAVGFVSGNGLSTGSTGNDDGRPSAFNDLGQLAFNARFTDGTSGIFVSDIATIPEPTSLLLIAAATVLIISGCRVSRRVPI